MREAVLIVLVIVLGLVGLGNARIALLAYIWFAVMRPDVLAWATDRPYSLALGAVAALSTIRELHHLLPSLRIRWLALFIALIGWIFLSALFSHNLEGSLFTVRFFLPTVLTAILVPVVLRTFEDVRKLYLVLAFSLGFLGLKFGLWGVLKGGVQFTGGYGGALSDNNMFALAMVIALPLCWYARDICTGHRWKMAFLSFSIFIIPATIMSHSRGGLLAMGIVVLFIAWHSRRRILTIIVLAVLLVPSAWLVKDSISERMATMTEVDDDNSAQTRLTHWRGAIRMSFDYPILGVGFGGQSYTQKIGSYIGIPSRHYAHNNYLQMLADSGYPALILFCMLLFGQIFWLRRTGLRFKKHDPVMYSMAMGMCGALVGFAAGSTFLSRTYYETIYYLLVFGAAFSPIAVQRLNAIRNAQRPNLAAGPPLPSPAMPGPVLPSPAEPEPARFKLGGRERVRSASDARPFRHS